MHNHGAGSGIRTHAAPRGHKLFVAKFASPGLLPTWLGDPGAGTHTLSLPILFNPKTVRNLSLPLEGLKALRKAYKPKNI